MKLYKNLISRNIFEIHVYKLIFIHEKKFHKI